MALLGQAALVMWWNIEPAHRADFEHWHAHQHFPERLRIAGFRRASRWRQADGGEGVLVAYELRDHAVLSSPAYLAHLNAPTDWSRRMMPLHRDMVRGQCEVVRSRGAFVAGHLLALRLSPVDDRPDAVGPMVDGLRTLVDDPPTRPGLAGAHVLRHREPEIEQTTEQRIRGGDRSAGVVLLISGYDRDALDAWARDGLSPERLAGIGASASFRGLYSLAMSASPDDLADMPGITGQ